MHLMKAQEATPQLATWRSKRTSSLKRTSQLKWMRLWRSRDAKQRRCYRRCVMLWQILSNVMQLLTVGFLSLIREALINKYQQSKSELQGIKTINTINIVFWGTVYSVRMYLFECCEVVKF